MSQFRLVCLAVLLFVEPTPAGPPLWGNLAPGPHAVGFRGEWQLDYTRRYNTTFEDKTIYAPGKAPRPILINLWYPAVNADKGEPMPHRDYLAIESKDAKPGPFAKALAAYARGVIAKEMLQKEAKELNERESRLLKDLLDSPTACRRDAPAAKGKFPLVIYHAGYGSSFEDNAVLCEFLASHGFVVVGSAFQDAEGKSFNIDAHIGSARDMEFLIAHARLLPYVDWDHVGVVGHSGGAHAALRFRSQDNCVVDAVVSLDTTQDYYGLSHPGWEDMIDLVTRNRQNMTGPILMAANPHAFFELADSLSSARRYYLTIKALGHNDFISQGVLSRGLQLRLNDKADEKKKAKLQAVRTGYEALCVYVLRFFEAELKGTAASKEYLATQHRKAAPGGEAPHVEFVPAGASGPDAYKAGASPLPTPRQLRPFLAKEGAAKTLELLGRVRKEHPDHPVYHPIFAFALVSQLLDQGKVKDAVAFRAFYKEFGADPVRWMLAYGDRNESAEWYKKVLTLEPGHAEAAKKLKALTKP